jgi:hypothetical protein
MPLRRGFHELPMNLQTFDSQVSHSINESLKYVSSDLAFLGMLIVKALTLTIAKKGYLTDISRLNSPE